MTKKDLEARRADWIEREERRLKEGRSARDAWFTWATAQGSFAETREEALEALERVPKHQGEPGTQKGMLVDFSLGKVNALAGRWDEAIPSLERVVSTCQGFDAIMLVTKA